jgi:hypothetical protein
MTPLSAFAAYLRMALLSPRRRWQSGKRSENVKKKKLLDSFAMLAYLSQKRRAYLFIKEERALSGRVKTSHYVFK